MCQIGTTRKESLPSTASPILELKRKTVAHSRRPNIKKKCKIRSYKASLVAYFERHNKAKELPVPGGGFRQEVSKRGRSAGTMYYRKRDKLPRCDYSMMLDVSLIATEYLCR